MARAMARLGTRLRAVEVRHAARQAARAGEPPFDPGRLTAEELSEVTALKARVPWRSSRPDFSALSDAEFDRLAALWFKGKGLVGYG